MPGEHLRDGRTTATVGRMVTTVPGVTPTTTTPTLTAGVDTDVTETVLTTPGAGVIARRRADTLTR